MRQTMEQRRAAHAWNCALDAKQKLERGNGKEGYKDYINAAKGMPALIMNSGLMQVMAYNQGKKEPRYKLLAGHLRQWLRKSLGTPDDFQDFMQHLLKADPREFQAITAEAFAWLRWLRQVAPAIEREDA